MRKFKPGGKWVTVVRTIAVLCLQGALLAIPATAQIERLILDSGKGPLELTSSLEVWVDHGGRTPLQKIEDGGLPFTPIVRGQKYLLSNAAFWLRFDAIVKDSKAHWKLELPMTGADKTTLYYRNAEEQWVEQQAGDTLPMSAWSQPGRYPVFALSQETDKTVRYYLRIEHARVPYSVMPRAVNDVRLAARHQQGIFLLGVYFGLAGLMVVLALIYAIVYRDLGFGSYAFYMATFGGAQGTLTGVAGLYWWPQTPVLNNLAVFMLPLMAASAALWLVRSITTPRRFSRALDWFVVALIVLLPFIGLIDAMLPSAASFSAMNLLVSVGMVVMLIVIGVSLIEGDRDARWIAAGFMPILLATLFPLLRNFGVLSSSVLTEYALILGSTIEAPVLFYGLLRRVTRRNEPNAREIALRSIDPLTGLASPRALLGKLGQTFRIAERYGGPCVLMLINLSNLAALRQQYGREVSDRALVVAASRIRESVQATDTAARVGDSQFALLIAAPMAIDSANDVATRILASGLRPSIQWPEADPLIFHIAIGYMAEVAKMTPEQPQACLARMRQAVSEINDGSGKKIRRIYL
jgi:diguanylate cyclase (GGDEF)-like protein